MVGVDGIWDEATVRCSVRRPWRADVPRRDMARDVDTAVHGGAPRRNPSLRDAFALAFGCGEQDGAWEASGRGAGVDLLVDRDEVAARLLGPLDSGESADVRAGEAVEARHDDPLRLARLHAIEEGVERGPGT